MTKIDPTTFRTGDIVHVRGKIDEIYADLTAIELTSDHGYNYSVSADSVVAHFPAIRSWSEIEGRLTALTVTFDENIGEIEMARAIIALLNEIDPKGDA